ncbi:MAG: hypothetical protein J7L23_00560 [Candidatus Diapherotrites archaeon]|nr:hypothetical protein [Candidatus Diapherotrites archaeon]
MLWGELKQKLVEKLEREGCDQEVEPYLDLVNSVPNLVTSSSCYGRMLLIDLPDYTKKNAKFLWKTHQPANPEDVWRALNECKGKFVWFKVDPLILHVSCKDIETASRLLKAKTRAGIKRGGIFSISEERVQIELEGTYKMELPVKKGNRILVSEDYFKLVIEEANKKKLKNTKMWERFAEEFKKEFGDGIRK